MFSFIFFFSLLRDYYKRKIRETRHTMTFSKMKQSAQCRELNTMLYNTGTKFIQEKKKSKKISFLQDVDDSAKSKLCLFLSLKKRFFLRFESENIFIKVTRH